MRKSLSWRSTRAALAVWCVLVGGLLLTTPPAFAAGNPEKPITEPCSGPIKAGGGVEVCGTLNPHSKEKLTSTYFTFSQGSTCTDTDRAPIDIAAGQEEAIKVSADLTGLEPNAEYSYCLVAENSVGETSSEPATFHTAPVVPAILNVSATEITDETATLEAQINPENSETEYEVVIAEPCGGPPDCILSSGKIIPSSGREYVRIELAGKELHLEPNTTYEYWIIAKNSDAQKAEVHETFTTLKTPSIDSESASDITEHDAILEAKINTQGQDVYYQFQIVKNVSEFPPEMACPAEHSAELCLGSSATTGALPIGFLLAGSADGSVGLDLERERGVTLQPETTYHYRVIAVRSPMSEDTITWKGPPAYGADQTFTTQGPRSTGLGFSTGGETGSGTGNVVCPNNVASTGCAVADLTRNKPKPLTRSQKLAKALRTCRKDHKKSRRMTCEKAARKSYGPLKAKSKHGKAKK
jgi:hypothetical protein